VSERPLLRTLLVALSVGVLSVSVAWAGAGLAPIDEGDERLEAGFGEELVTEATDRATAEGNGTAETSGPTRAAAADGGLLVGASRISMEPRPDDHDGHWETEGCATVSPDGDVPSDEHVHDLEPSPWPSKPGCIYMGGYGIGPMFPITAWDDEYGLHVRSVALGDGAETAVLTLIDAVYYLGSYQEMCDDCGALTIAERLGDELGIDPAGFFIAATHSHTAPDLIGGWGGVPDWYMEQVQDAIETSIREAVAAMEPAIVEVGEEIARPFNAERRNTYRSAEEPTMSWFRAVALDDADEDAGDEQPGDTDRSPRAPGGGEDDPADGDDGSRIIATVGAYGAHPVNVPPGDGVAHADWPGVFAAELEAADAGSVAMALPTGLGNLSPRGGIEAGAELASLLPQIGSAPVLDATDVRVAATRWTHPVTNSVLTGLAVPGFFDRPFDAGPAEVAVGTHPARQCVSASPLGVTTQVNAAAIGDLLITGAPGETFANLANTLRERNPNGVTMPLGMTNDGLGYIIQSFESDHSARQGGGFVGGEAGFEYEDAYSIDHCFGDQVLESTIALIADLRG
jgi:hypothetical protein